MDLGALDEKRLVATSGPIITYVDGTTLQERLREKYPKMFERDSSA